MIPRFLVDAQLPPAIARQLSQLGFESVHVQDLGLAGADDTTIWFKALELGTAIITKDEDFADRIALDPDGPPIVWLRIGNSSKAALIDWFLPLLSEVCKKLEAGEKLIEVV